MEMQRQLPLPIKLEEASKDLLEIIDLDSRTSSEDIILEWCTKVRMKFKHFFIADSERNLDIIMKWYIQSFKEDAMNIEDAGAVKPLLFKHIQFFKLFFHELNCSFTDNYLDNMEELLAIYSDLEAETLPSRQNETNKRAYKRNISKVCCKIIGILNAYLLYREDRLTHVVMKMKLNLHSEETRDLMNQLYGTILTKEPVNKSDLAFCRAYILYQKWKKIRPPENWEQMDVLMYKMYDRTPESLGANDTLKQILLPQSESILDVLSHISDNYTVITEEYFKFVRTQNIQEDSLVSLDLTSIELEDQCGTGVVINSEDEDFEHAYNNYVESMSKISESCDVVETSRMKSENQEEEEECLIVGIGTVDCEPKNVELVHEIVDDEDGDIIDIIFFEEKKRTKTPENQLSFLDSITVSENRTASPTRQSFSTRSPSTISTEKSFSSCTISPPPLEIDASPERPPEEEEVLEVPSALQTCEDDSPKIISPPSSVFAVPAEKPPRTRKIFTREPLRKKKIILRKLIKKRRLLIKKYASSIENTEDSSHKDCSDVKEPEPLIDVNSKAVAVPAKIMNHIETQTDFSHGEQQEDIFKRFKGLVTPPSDEHIEDHEINKELSNVYTDLIPAFQCPKRDRMTETDYLTGSSDKSVGIDDSDASGRYISSPRPAVDNVQGSPTKELAGITENDDQQNDKVPEPKSSSSEEVDSQNISGTQDQVSESCCKSKLLISSSASPNTSDSFAKNTKLKVLSNVLCTSSDFSSDYSPSSSTLSLNPKQRRSNESYPSPASPDISSTSHDHYAEICSAREGDSDENRTDYRSINGFFSDTEEDDYEDHNEVATLEKDRTLPEEEAEGCDEILIEDHFLPSTNEAEDNSGSPKDAEEDGVVDNITNVKDFECGLAHRSKTKEIAFSSGGPESESFEKIKEADNCQLKQLKVTVPKFNLKPASEILKLQERIFIKDKKVIHSHWGEMQIHHDLDDIWSGPIEKFNGINSCVNPDKTFDLFDNKTPCSETPCETLLHTPTHSTASTCDLRSPSYENMDDFQNYLDNFEDNITNTAGQRVSYSSNVKTGETTWDRLMARKPPVKSVDNTSGYLSVIPDASTKNMPVRKKRIAFAENIIEIPTAHSPCELSNVSLQGILKKPLDAGTNRSVAAKRNTRPRIPRRMMNLRSLARYNVKPNDPCIQGVPCVVVERMSQSEIDQWDRVSEISRKVRLQKTQARQNLTSSFRVDYDKTTSNLNENDIIQFNKPEGLVPAAMKQWRSHKSPEGYKSGDLPYTVKKNGKRKRDNSVLSSQEKHKKRGKARIAIEKMYS